MIFKFLEVFLHIEIYGIFRSSVYFRDIVWGLNVANAATTFKLINKLDTTRRKINLPLPFLIWEQYVVKETSFHHFLD